MNLEHAVEELKFHRDNITDTRSLGRFAMFDEDNQRSVAESEKRIVELREIIRQLQVGREAVSSVTVGSGAQLFFVVTVDTEDGPEERADRSHYVLAETPRGERFISAPFPAGDEGYGEARRFADRVRRVGSINLDKWGYHYPAYGSAASVEEEADAYAHIRSCLDSGGNPEEVFKGHFYGAFV